MGDWFRNDRIQWAIVGVSIIYIDGYIVQTIFNDNYFCVNSVGRFEKFKQRRRLYFKATNMGLFDALAGILKLRKEQINILVVGLNNSGKSTIVNHFKNPEERPSITVPTVGFSVEKFQSELHF